MGETISVTTIVRHFADYVNRVVYRHEYFVLLRGKKAVAELRPIPRGRRLGELMELLNSLPHLSKEEVESLSKEMAETRTSLSKRKLRDPWAF